MKSQMIWGTLLASVFAAQQAAAQVVQESVEGGTTEPGGAAKTSGGQQSRFIFSPVGPGAGHGTIGMGGRVYFVIPTYNLNYVRGISDNFDFILNMDTLGILSFGDLGVRFRLVGDAESGFSLGVKGAVTAMLAFISVGDSSGAAIFIAATPGLMAGFGSRSTQFTLGVDVPIFLGGAGFTSGNGNSTSGSTSDVAVTIRPNATIEFGVSDSTNMYIQAAGYISTEGGGFFGPILAVGAAW